MFCNLYCDKKSEKYSHRSIKSVKDIGDVSVHEFTNAKVIVDVKTTAYAVFDEKNKLVKSSLVYRGKNHQFIPKNQNVDIEYMDCEAVYVGNIYPHFGHFLVEHLNRLYGVFEIKSKQLKYIFIDNQNIGAQSFVYEFMRVFGVKKSDVIILNKSVQFKKIYIPSQTLNISSALVSDKIAIGYKAMSKNVKSFGYDKVYMSRTKLKNNKNVFGEEKIQKIFEKNGYKIIYPETMTITEQIAVVNNAKYLAGCAGTALHWALFMKPGGTVICLKRNSKDDINVRTQYMLNKASGLNSVFIWASIEKYPSKHSGSGVPHIIGVNHNVKKFFDDFGFKYTSSDIKFDDNLNKKYLEIYAKYKQENGGAIKQYFYKKFIKFASCLIPGRINRKRFRHWLKLKLK